MTDDAFEALWYLFQAARPILAKMARGTGTKSQLTYFREALNVARDRSNNAKTFYRFLEKEMEFNFKVDNFGYPLPSQTALEKLFRDLKSHGLLLYMPQLTERFQETQKKPEVKAEEESA